MFDDVGDAVHGLVPGASTRSWRSGIKVWLGSGSPPREHYEAQLTRDGIEVGFHSEHPKEEDNEAVIARLRAAAGKWRKSLGNEPVAGAFLGHASHWRRVSEVWPDPDLDDPSLVMEIATRLADYVTALEPHRPSL